MATLNVRLSKTTRWAHTHPQSQRPGAHTHSRTRTIRSACAQLHTTRTHARTHTLHRRPAETRPTPAPQSNTCPVRRSGSTASGDLDGTTAVSIDIHPTTHRFLPRSLAPQCFPQKCRTCGEISAGKIAKSTQHTCRVAATTALTTNTVVTRAPAHHRRSPAEFSSMRRRDRTIRVGPGRRRSTSTTPQRCRNATHAVGRRQGLRPAVGQGWAHRRQPRVVRRLIRDV